MAVVELPLLDLAVVSAGGANYSNTGESQLPLMNFTMV